MSTTLTKHSTPGGRVKRPKARNSAVAPLRGLLPVLLGLVVWELVVDESVFYPPPSQWLEALRGMNADGDLVGPLLTTLQTFVISLAIATVLGTVIGMLIGSKARVERGLNPIMEFFRSLPPPAIVPLATLLLGITLKASIAIVVLAVVWPILLNVAAATRALPTVRTEMTRTLGLSRSERLLKILVPSVVPGIFIGVRISVSISLVVTLLVDILGSADGAGRVLVERQQSFDSPAVWGLLLIIGIFGYLLNVLLALVEDRMLRTWPART